MTTKITFVVDNPTDVETFETAYRGVLDAARTVPTVNRVESARVWPKEDGTPTPAHRTLDLYFDDYATASAAITTAAAGSMVQQLLATGTPFTALFTDVEASSSIAAPA